MLYQQAGRGAAAAEALSKAAKLVEDKNPQVMSPAVRTPACNKVLSPLQLPVHLSHC